MNTRKFNYKSIDDLKSMLNDLDVALPITNDIDVLSKNVKVKNKNIVNRIAIQPMEGADGKLAGAPAELTKRRYKRFAEGGAGLIWFEAVAVSPEGRANPHQLMITKKNADEYKELVNDIKETCIKSNGFEPVVIMQLTHSGRYSKPNGVAEPIIAYNNPLFEKENPIDKDRIISDEELKKLENKMGIAAKVVEDVGFDGVDIKACHRYLGSELLSAYLRKGEYGGNFENRIRFLINSIQNSIANTSSNFVTTTRLNIYDGFRYPYGFGVNEQDGLTPDLSEAVKLVDIIHNKLGVEMINISIGNPYVNPHVNRPADVVNYQTGENPLVGVQRVLNCTKEIQQKFKDLVVVGSALSYLRQFSPNLAAAAIKENYFTIAGFGRLSIAYPNFAKDILQKGALDAKSCCITCGKCTQLLRNCSATGCIAKDNSLAEILKSR